MRIQELEDGVQAVHITEANIEEAAAWCKGKLHQERNMIVVPTRIGRLEAAVGKWLVKTPDGWNVLTDYRFRKVYK